MVKKSLIAAALAVAGLGVSANASVIVAGPVVNPNNGHAYFILSPDSWDNAEALAQSLGGHLATVNDADENAWINTTIGAGLNLWIGLNDAAVDGTFVWSSGETPSYANWDSPQPDNHSGHNSLPQQYVIMRPVGMWDDINVAESTDPDYGAGVFAVAEVVPEPASLSLLGLGAATLIARRRRA